MADISPNGFRICGQVQGQLVPILVRWRPDLDLDRVIDGGRRFQAASVAGERPDALLAERTDTKRNMNNYYLENILFVI